jgi:hypothetical protein
MMTVPKTISYNYECRGVDVPFTMMIRRARLVDALRSGQFRQGKGSLFREYTTDGNGGGGYYCCIGVGCFLLGFPDSILMEDMESEYLEFELKYGLSHRTAKYLMAMNDGDAMGDVLEDDDFRSYLPRHFRLIRLEGNQRNFKEVARFLEIIWRMTPSGDTEN